MLNPRHSFVGPLLAWHEENGRHELPWREPDRSAFEILVAEILLQRTNATAVSGAYIPFVARYPSPETVVATRTDAIKRRISSLGLSKRAEFIQRSAQTVLARHLGDALAPSERGSDFQHAMLDFAADVCTARSPRCDACPLREACLSSKHTD